jgi:hypothetical protein
MIQEGMRRTGGKKEKQMLAFVENEKRISSERN